MLIDANTAVHKQNALSLISEIFVGGSDFSDMIYSSACVGHVQSLIAKKYLATIL